MKNNSINAKTLLELFGAANESMLEKDCDGLWLIIHAFDHTEHSIKASLYMQMGRNFIYSFQKKSFESSLEIAKRLAQYKAKAKEQR